MEKLVFDTGLKEYEINGGAVLRFNPSDPNVYARISDAAGEIEALEKTCMDRAKAEEAKGDKPAGEILIAMLRDADREAKRILGEAFGHGNDFDQIFGGVNIVSRNRSGKRIIDAFLEAVFPIIEDGVKELIRADEAAVEKYTAEYD